MRIAYYVESTSFIDKHQTDHKRQIKEGKEVFCCKAMWSRVERVHIIRGFSQTIFVLDFWRTYVPSAPQRLQTKASLMKVINDIEDMRNLDHNMLVFGSWIAFTSTSPGPIFMGQVIAFMVVSVCVFLLVYCQLFI